MIIALITILITAVGVLAGTVAYAVLHRPRGLEKTNTVTDEFIENPIPSGFYIIVGPQGVGKTSFMNALISTDFKYHSDERLQRARDEASYLNGIEQTKRYKLTVPPCAYRTRSKLFLPNGKPTYHIDISEFGLPGRRKEVHYLPPYTVIGCDEIDSIMDCRFWNENKDMKADIIDGFKYIRHQNLVFLADAQSLEKVDVALRRLATDVIYILGKKDIYGKCKRFSRHTELLRTVWDFVWVKNQQMKNVATLAEMGIALDASNYSRKCKFIYEGNIYKQYNSLSGKPYWYNGIEQYTIEKHPENVLSRDGVEKYCNQNLLRFDDKQEEREKKSRQAQK